ncbi:hypothetical protein GCM10009665_20640 [Kitasatospora nipponensis]|uniref:Uncharacterized protein n=1 Tax=Kitasatospora nipponensis TaxID=258049 RepID=A0ABN1W0P5_9ACTN
MQTVVPPPPEPPEPPVVPGEPVDPGVVTTMQTASTTHGFTPPPGPAASAGAAEPASGTAEPASSASNSRS